MTYHKKAISKFQKNKKDLSQTEKYFYDSKFNLIFSFVDFEIYVQLDSSRFQLLDLKLKDLSYYYNFRIFSIFKLSHFGKGKL
jgi:hypothetical protein